MSSNAKIFIASLFWFGVVGLSALLVHFLVVTQLLVPIGWHPLLANTGGFFIAFIVSFFGHHQLTFKEQTRQANAHMGKAAGKFFLVAVGSFLLNQVMFSALLQFSSWSLDICLAITLVAVAVVTFITSKLWAFKHTGTKS